MWYLLQTKIPTKITLDKNIFVPSVNSWSSRNQGTKQLPPSSSACFSRLHRSNPMRQSQRQRNRHNIRCGAGLLMRSAELSVFQPNYAMRRILTLGNRAHPPSSASQPCVPGHQVLDSKTRRPSPQTQLYSIGVLDR